jgi:hypothetical protein
LEIRRDDDGELCGHVRERAGAWEALTVFGGVLGTHTTRRDAEIDVRDNGLASLAERWQFRADPSAEWQVVCIQEASTTEVRLALDYYSLPGVETVVVTREELDNGATLSRR